ncbi:MAG: FAD-dependent oxidoreductase, partial [Armatimonadota bacterium]|nr:FAD-dependent oxidoreductase [Armatimonadota bacterium]
MHRTTLWRGHGRAARVSGPKRDPRNALRALTLRVFPVLLILGASAAWSAEAPLPPQTFADDTLGEPPAGWEGPGGPHGWSVEETQDLERPGRTIASTAVGAAPSSFLTRRLGALNTPFVLHFYARAQQDVSRRGLSWGMSEGAPNSQPARAFQLALGPGGALNRFDGAAWQKMAPIKPGAWHRITITVFPRAGEFEVSLDGVPLTPQPLPFWNAVTPDTLFLNNFAAGPEGAEILATGFEVRLSPIPEAPAGLRIFRLHPDAVELDWLAPETPVRGYRVFRNGEAVADLPGDATRFRDAGLKPSTFYLYRLAALGDGEPAPLSRLSRPAADWTLPPPGTNAPRGDAYDVVVVGATPAGIAAALAAARLGASVALTESSRWVGGMMAGGLSNTDYRFRETHGGFFKEFTGQVLDYYQRVYGPNSRQVQVCMGGYKFEPRVARAVLIRMVAGEPRISLYLQTRPVGVTMKDRRVTGVQFENLASGGKHTLTGKMFIDATYEGDVAAFAGAEFRVGRESREDFNEQHAGELYWNMDTRKIEWDKGSGKGDHRVQAYNYRLTMTGRADNRVLCEKPEGYDRTRYLKIIGDVKSGYANLKRVLGYQGL